MSDLECKTQGCRRGWLYDSIGTPIDVCEDCHGTGLSSPWEVQAMLEEFPAEIERLRAERDTCSESLKQIIELGKRAAAERDKWREAYETIGRDNQALEEQLGKVQAEHDRYKLLAIANLSGVTVDTLKRLGGI